jgi:hypothetical protein
VTHELSRRNFLLSAAAASAIALAAPSQSPAQTKTPESLFALEPLGDRVHPITPDEFHARLLRGQELMGLRNPNSTPYSSLRARHFIISPAFDGI